MIVTTTVKNQMFASWTVSTCFALTNVCMCLVCACADQQKRDNNNGAGHATCANNHLAGARTVDGAASKIWELKLTFPSVPFVLYPFPSFCVLFVLPNQAKIMLFSAVPKYRESWQHKALPTFSLSRIICEVCPWKAVPVRVRDRLLLWTGWYRWATRRWNHAYWREERQAVGRTTTRPLLPTVSKHFMPKISRSSTTTTSRENSGRFSFFVRFS